jgi:hypothetical protein
VHYYCSYQTAAVFLLLMACHEVSFIFLHDVLTVLVLGHSIQLFSSMSLMEFEVLYIKCRSTRSRGFKLRIDAILTDLSISAFALLPLDAASEALLGVVLQFAHQSSSGFKKIDWSPDRFAMVCLTHMLLFS